MNKIVKHVIWSNEDLDYERDWKADIENEYPDMTEDERIEEMYRMNAEYLQDERMNLSVALENDVIVFGDLGLWDGRHDAIRFMKVGKIGDLLGMHEYEYATWYVDEDGDLVLKGVHHDGTNYEVFRMLKPGYSEEVVVGTPIPVDRSHIATREEVTEKLGKRIADVYGWAD